MDESMLEETTDCWFDEPALADRRSWAIPPGHGTYQGLDLELLDPVDEDDLSLPIEAQHTEFADALRSDEEMIMNGEPYRAAQEHRPFDPGDYARRLNELPGDWPPPQALSPQ